MKHLITKTCDICGKVETLSISEETFEDYQKYLSHRIQYVQDIRVPEYDLPRAKAIIREHLRIGSNFCLNCQQLLFSFPDTEDDIYDSIRSTAQV